MLAGVHLLTYVLFTSVKEKRNLIKETNSYFWWILLTEKLKPAKILRMEIAQKSNNPRLITF